MLRSARRTLEQSLEADFSSDKTRRNLARVCLKMGDREAAIAHASGVQDKDLECFCVLAASHHGAGQYKESYAAYQVKTLQYQRPQSSV